jgi:phage terminase large subunit-like protein
MKDLIADTEGVTRTISITESTYANRDNLSAMSMAIYEKRYGGTRLGRQELFGEILEDVEGALWAYEWIENNRDKFAVTINDMDRIVVGIDPAGTSSKQRDETGIIVCGKKGDHYFVFHDASGHMTPKGWGERAWKVFDDYKADKIVAEKNYGGEMVLSTLTNVRETGPTKLVHSRRGKKLRAEPIAALYEQGRVHHVGVLEDLESQLVSWVPDQGDSPDRIDALVHALTELTGGGGPASFAVPQGDDFAGTEATLAVLTSTGFGYTPREASVYAPDAPVRS